MPRNSRSLASPRPRISTLRGACLQEAAPASHLIWAPHVYIALERVYEVLIETYFLDDSEVWQTFCKTCSRACGCASFVCKSSTWAFSLFTTSCSTDAVQRQPADPRERRGSSRHKQRGQGGREVYGHQEGGTGVACWRRGSSRRRDCSADFSKTRRSSCPTALRS